MSFPTPFPIIFGDEDITSEDTTVKNPGRDVKLDLLTMEPVIVGGDLVLTSDVEAITQAVNLRLRMFLGEWYLDLTQGVPYFQKILIKSPDNATIKATLRAEILKVAGIVSVISLELTGDAHARTLAVAWQAQYSVNALNGVTSPQIVSLDI